MIFDSTFWILVLPTLLFAMYAQFRVSSTFKKYSNVGNNRGLTGAEAARQILERCGVNDVMVERVNGNLTDHYDPRERILRLSESVYSSQSLSAVGVAAHETGHAIQHAQGYAPLNIRNGIFPVVGFGSKLSVPLILVGMLLASGQGSFGLMLVDIGIVLFAVVVIFQLITLPVEFNASARAVGMLEDYNLLTADELIPAKKVLNAAALTYVAAALTSVAQLLRFVLLSNRRR